MQPIDTSREAIEFFQVAFLRELARVLPSTSYAIKGGCNLRMLLGSSRASEDLDIDVRQVASHTLQKHMQKVLAGPMVQILAAVGITIIESSAPKQTPTVQRWKVSLGSMEERIPTKVEFSRREFSGTPVLSPISGHIQQRYEVEPFPLSHYDHIEALWQKIHALAGRPISQARDVFDAFFLLSGGTKLPEKALQFEQRALDNLPALSFAAYSSQVLPFLDPDAVVEHGSPDAWERLKLMVGSSIKAHLESGEIQG